MHFSFAFAGFCLSPVLAGVVSPTVTERDAPSTSCSASAISPKPKGILCGVEGGLGQANKIGRDRAASSQEACALACLSNDSCKSFSYSTRRLKTPCRLFGKTVRQQQFSQKTSGETFFNRRCYTSSCTQPTTTATTTTTSDSSAATSILPTTIPDTIYTPEPVPDYSKCNFDPSTSSFSLLDNDGVPFVNLNGRAQRADQVLDTLPSYQFTPSEDGTAGLYDLVLDGKYLAVNTDAEMVFVSSSTGPKYVTDGGQTFITSIFSYTCDGALLVGIPGVVPFEMGVKDGKLYGQPILDQYNPGPTLPTLKNLKKRAIIDDATRLAITQTRYQTFDKRSLIVAPKPTDTPAQVGPLPRCPNTPKGLVASDGSATRPPQANGCAAKIPGASEPLFETCCNQHDYCYDNCATDFTQCNSNFATCMKQQCDTTYSGTGTNNLILNWGCQSLAAYYSAVVSTTSGADAFTKSNTERCTCSCPAHTDNCNGECTGIVNDNNNCGGCGVTCTGTSFCQFDTCYTPPPTTSDPCDVGNWEDWGGTAAPLADGASEVVSRDDITDKKACCQACYSTKGSGQGGCLRYSMTQTYKGLTNTFADPYNYDSKCSLLIQNAQVTNVTDQLQKPWPTACPDGGARIFFWDQGLGGTAPCDACRQETAQTWNNCFQNYCQDVEYTDAEAGNCAVVYRG